MTGIARGTESPLELQVILQTAQNKSAQQLMIINGVSFIEINAVEL